jgi:hypothetical protein
MVSASGFSDRARELEESARAAELHEVALTEATGGLVVEVIERGYADLGLPVPVEFVRALLGGWPAPVDGAVVHAARDLVRRAVRAELPAEVVVDAAASVPDEDVGDDPGIDDESVNDVVIDLDADEDELAEDELVALGEIPMAFRNRFAIGDEGQHRSRVAWTRRVRAEKAQRAAAEEAAEDADEQRRQDAAAARAARRADPGPAPSGWNSRGGRGRGPAGERAGG